MDRKEQIKQAKRLIATGISKDLVEVLEKQFPELAESEDERIRKWIVNFIEVRLPDAEEFEPEYRAALAYLEKQKDEVQKQFNLGVQAGREEAMYEMEKEKMGEPKEWADELSAEIDRISKRYPEVSFAKLSRVAVHFSRWQKEQQTPDSLLCDLDLFASSREDCEKIRVHIREIRKIIAGIPDEQKSAEWSEEDEKIRDEVIGDLCALKDWIIKYDTNWLANPVLIHIDKRIAWLKALSERFNLSPKQEWSEEDKKLLDFWLDVIDRNDWRMDENFCKASREFINRLKSLRPQPHWKPSEEQMKALNEVANDGVLLDLFNDLLKLL